MRKKRICLIFIAFCLMLGLCSCSDVKSDPIQYEFSRSDRFKTNEGDIIIDEGEGAFHWSFDEIVALYFNALIDDINDSHGKDINLDNVFYQYTQTQVDAVKDSNCDAATKVMVYKIDLGIHAVRYAIANYNANKTEENFAKVISSMDDAHEVYCSYVK